MFLLPRRFLFAAAAAVSLSTGPVAAATVTATRDVANVASFIGAEPALRFRALNAGQNELYVGRADLGVGTNRVEANLAYAAAAPFAFAYDGVTGRVSARYGSVTQGFALAAGLAFNALRIDIAGARVARGGGTNSFALSAITVNGQAIPDLAGPATTPRSTLSWVVGRLTGGSVMVTGTLAYAGDLSAGGSPEAAKVDLRLGSLPPVPLPASLPLMLLAMTALALAAWGRRRPARLPVSVSDR